MSTSLKKQADQMLEIFLRINKQFRWQHSLSNHFAALTYMQKNKEFDKENIENVIKVIKKNTGMFSCYRGNSMFILAMLLCSEFSNPEEKFMKMLEYDKKLRGAGFKNNQYLTIANYTLLLTCEDNLIDNRISKAYDIYRKMKENHPWLTSGDDYPLCILMAGFDRSVDTIEEYYTKLNQEGFSKGNGLQLLSHILSFSSENIDVTVKRCKELYDKLKENKLKIFSNYYAALGLIALLEDNNGIIAEELIELSKYINSLKKYKWLGKGMNVLLASAIVSEKYIKERIEHNSLIDTTVNISIETLIAAQTSAAIAGMTASFAAVSAAN